MAATAKLIRRAVPLACALSVLAAAVLAGRGAGADATARPDGPAALSSTAALPSGPVATYDTGSSNHPTAVAVQGGYAYVVNSCGVTCYGPLDVLDVANPATPTLTGSTPVSWGAGAIAVQGAYAYVTGFFANPNYMRVMHVSQPSAPSSAAAFTVAGNHPLGIAVRGRFAYMLDYGANRLDVIDVSNPGASSFSTTLNSSYHSLPLIARIRTAAAPSHIAVQGPFAYVVNSVADDLQVISIADPARPAVIGTSASLGPRGTRGQSDCDIAVEGAYAFVANDDTDRLQVVDVAHPARPVVVATAPVGVHPDALSVQGRYAYVVNRGSDTLEVFDIASPRAPTLVGSVPTGAEPHSVAVSGGYAYVTNYAGHTVQVFDLSALGG
jgi:hypothetical protein